MSVKIESRDMKFFFIVLAVFFLQTIGCTKNNSKCITTVITSSAPGCGGWGISINNIKYPSSNIPLEFQHDGMQVCAEYEFYEDMRLCACCGGTWVNIKSMKNLPD